MACRDEEKTNEAIASIKKSLEKSIGGRIDIQFMKLDLTSFASVREFSAAFCASKWFYLVALYSVVVHCCMRHICYTV